MGFLSALGPILEGASLVGGLFGGGSGGSLSGNAGNAEMNALNGLQEQFQVQNYAQQVFHQEHMQNISTAFDEMMDEKSEQMREVNSLRDVQMAQRKADNAITKKFIASITE